MRRLGLVNALPFLQLLLVIERRNGSPGGATHFDLSPRRSTLFQSPTRAEARPSLCGGSRARALAIALLGMPMLLGGCSRTISESTILHGHSAPREELREDLLRHNVELGSASGELLRGWHLENPRATRMVVFFANNTTTLLENAESLWKLADALRADVVAFDYRGYGFSSGTPSLRAMLDDAPRVSAFARVIAERRGLPIAVVGQSLGTFPAGRAAAPA